MTTVMIVDDNEEVISIVGQLLKSEGFEVCSALGGKACIESIRDLNPSILLLDVLMPDMDGWDVLRELKSMGVLDRTKVIMLTVVKEPKEDDDDADLSPYVMSPYIMDYITKPFDGDELIERVKRLSLL